jgi:hypothetical protein
MVLLVRYWSLFNHVISVSLWSTVFDKVVRSLIYTSPHVVVAKVSVHLALLGFVRGVG